MSCNPTWGNLYPQYLRKLGKVILEKLRILKLKSWKIARKLTMRKLFFLILNKVTKYILETM